MTCQTGQKLFLAYIDNDLSPGKTQQLENHLFSCSHCQEKLKQLSEIYRPATEIQKIEPAPFLWQKIYSKISEQKNKQEVFEWLPKRLLLAGSYLALLLVFCLSVLLGIYLGSSPNLITANLPTENTPVIVNENFENDAYLTTFDNLPRESIGNVYLAMEAE